MKLLKIFFSLILIFSLASCDSPKNAQLNEDKLVVKDGVESLSMDSFGVNIANAKDVYLPKSLKSLKSQAFFNLGKVENIYYEGSLLDWCNITFANEYSNPLYNSYYNDTKFYVFENNRYQLVSDLILPEGLKKISPYTFTGIKINNLIIPKSLEIIDEYAFFMATIGGEIIIPSEGDLRRLEANSFNHVTYNNHLRLPANLEYIGKNALLLTNSTDITLPYLGNLSIDIPFLNFIGASRFKNVYINKGEEIGLFADEFFNGNVFFPDSVTKILPNAFHNSYVNGVYFSSNSQLVEISDEAFSMIDNMDFFFVPKSLNRVHPYAFKGSNIKYILSHATTNDELQLEYFDFGNYKGKILIKDFMYGWQIKDNVLYIFGNEVSKYNGDER